MEENPIRHMFVTTELEEERDPGWRERGPGARIRKGLVKAIDLSVLKDNMGTFFQQLKEILDTGKDRIGSFRVDRVEVSAQVTGEGKVCLMGSGAGIGIGGGIKFVLHREDLSSRVD